jgi:ketosteroid isomerase-like protein
MLGSHSNVTTLSVIYADLRRIADYCDDDVVLHTADRGASGGPAQVTGKKAVLDKELDLIRLTGGTLHMDVRDIVANDYFGAVLGVLRAHRDGSSVGMPFCGLWRFRDGRIIEHWENAYDASVLGEFLVGELASVAPWLSCGRNASDEMQTRI